MLSVNIGTTEDTNFIKTKLFKEFVPLKEEGFDLKILETQAGSYNFLGCNLISATEEKGLPDAGIVFRHYLANTISDLVLEWFEKPLVRKIIDQNYYYFEPYEQDQIFALAAVALESGEFEGSEALYRIGRKTHVLHKVLDYLEVSNNLILEGFITFRLREYIEELEEAVDHAVDDFMMDQEHREFVRLLKYFVDVQEPRVGEIHVMVTSGGRFDLKDGSGSPVQEEYLQELMSDLRDPDINYEDLLISALVTVAPSKIWLHGLTSERSEATETIKAVFPGRVHVCAGCQKCNSSAEQKTETIYT